MSIFYYNIVRFIKNSIMSSKFWYGSSTIVAIKSSSTMSQFAFSWCNCKPRKVVNFLSQVGHSNHFSAFQLLGCLFKSQLLLNVLKQTSHLIYFFIRSFLHTFVCLFKESSQLNTLTHFSHLMSLVHFSCV